MTDKVTPFTGDGRDLIDIDALLGKVDALEGDSAKIYTLALRSFGDAAERLKPDSGDDDARPFFNHLAMAYLAIGSMLGAKRDWMVKSLVEA